ncbi:uncharacterized protein EAE97_005560 [Botrytis byssoidea]|uniref:Uncharacterized protein n=1 Tax=Botrytis byssoidea TaxID=139641 RepID=A0A9P5M741_9HELO|nr:uncharacterized protein EAE97_005560 [Botrytis byssoidea]KAF7944927.1 hypothetical protein EAE97_005560 [Botrytis byssoidea]
MPSPLYNFISSQTTICSVWTWSEDPTLLLGNAAKSQQVSETLAKVLGLRTESFSDFIHMDTIYETDN